ncbi:MAG TPA: tetratricopeptide repeat protein [Deltaproteobacteria bacterium]|nr:tetratricopeptide repeat protein [Deltaproteobacteria bacterium]
MVKRSLLSIVLAVLLVTGLSPAGLEAAGPGAAAGGGPADVEALAAEAASALSRRLYKAAAERMEAMLARDPSLAPRVAPLLAYAYERNGERERGLKLLAGSRKARYALARAAITGAPLRLDGLEREVARTGLFFVDVGLASGVSGMGLESAVRRKALERALKDAFLSLVAEPGKKELSRFNDNILSSADSYYLSHYIFSTGEGRGFFRFAVVVFIDMGALTDTLESYGMIKARRKSTLQVGLLTRKGSDRLRKMLLSSLRSAGFNAVDMGAGALNPETMKTKGSIVVEISESPRVAGTVLGSNFKSIECVVEFAVVNGNNGVVITRLKGSHSLVHLNEEAGKEAAVKLAYEKVADTLRATLSDIGKRMGEEIASGALPPIELSVADSVEIFSNIYKSYAEEPFASVRLVNNSEREIRGVKVTLMVKDYMDFPSERLIERMAPGQKRTVELTAVFNNRVLELTENTLLQSEIVVTYYDGAESRSVTAALPIHVYEKHALVWDDKAKIASFITPRDPVVSTFASMAVREYNFPYINQALVKARAVFEALGVLGVTYIADPTPYATVSSDTTIVDHVQYPRETLERKGGDCDDLVSLFGAALESLGIKVMPVDAPSHLFIMFDTSIPEHLEGEFGFPPDMYVVHDGTIWVPFETTLVGSSFLLAWEKGVENYGKWGGEAAFVDPRKAWKKYLPATLPPAEFKGEVSKAAIEKVFGGELEELRRRRVRRLAARYLDLGEKGLAQAVIVYGENGLVDDALALARKLDASGALTPDTANNIGNVHFLKGDYEKALGYYRMAREKDATDPGILVNMARAYLKLGDRERAREVFAEAMAMDAGVKEKYLKVYVELGQ